MILLDAPLTARRTSAVHCPPETWLRKDRCGCPWCKAQRVHQRLTDLSQGDYIVDTGETVMGSRGRYVSVWRVAS